MKKMKLLFLVFLLIFTSCNNLNKNKNTKTNKTSIRKVNSKETPVPEFVEIEKYIRPTYNNMTSDEIRRETYIAENPHLDITLKSLILKGGLRVGMYKEEVFASVGQARNKIQYPTEFGIKEEWIYPEDILHLENGVLKNIEKTKR